MRHGLSSKPSMSCTTILRWARSTSLMNSFTAGIMSEAAPLRIAHTSCPGNLYTFSTSPMRVPSAVTTEHPMISWTKYDPFFSFTARPSSTNGKRPTSGSAEVRSFTPRNFTSVLRSPAVTSSISSGSQSAADSPRNTSFKPFSLPGDPVLKRSFRCPLRPKQPVILARAVNPRFSRRLTVRLSGRSIQHFDRNTLAGFLADRGHQRAKREGGPPSLPYDLADIGLGNLHLQNQSFFAALFFNRYQIRLIDELLGDIFHEFFHRSSVDLYACPPGIPFDENGVSSDRQAFSGSQAPHMIESRLNEILSHPGCSPEITIRPRVRVPVQAQLPARMPPEQEVLLPRFSSSVPLSCVPFSLRLSAVSRTAVPATSRIRTRSWPHRRRVSSTPTSARVPSAAGGSGACPSAALPVPARGKSGIRRHRR